MEGEGGGEGVDALSPKSSLHPSRPLFMLNLSHVFVKRSRFMGGFKCIPTFATRAVFRLEHMFIYHALKCAYG